MERIKQITRHCEGRRRKKHSTFQPPVIAFLRSISQKTDIITTIILPYCIHS